MTEAPKRAWGQVEEDCTHGTLASTAGLQTTVWVSALVGANGSNHCSGLQAIWMMAQQMPGEQGEHSRGLVPPPSWSPITTSQLCDSTANLKWNTPSGRRQMTS